MKWEQRQEKSRGKVKVAKKVRWMGSRDVGENFNLTPYNWVRWYWSDYCICRDSDISLPGWYSTVPEYLNSVSKVSAVWNLPATVKQRWFPPTFYLARWSSFCFVRQPIKRHIQIILLRRPATNALGRTLVREISTHVRGVEYTRDVDVWYPRNKVFNKRKCSTNPSLRLVLSTALLTTFFFKLIPVSRFRPRSDRCSCSENVICRITLYPTALPFIQVKIYRTQKQPAKYIL